MTLEIDDLHCSYDLAEVLTGVSMEVQDGALVALLGRNGMGKTSLCRCVMGLAPPQISRGEVRFKGTVLNRLSTHKIARFGLGYVPQGRRVFPSLDVVENLTMSARGLDGRDGWGLERVWDIFPRLAERKRHGAGQLSGGEQQMLAIGRALMTNPELLVMDEPSEGLAPVIVENLAEQLEALKGASGLSILLVEQNYVMALRLADVVYVMENGRIVFKGTPEEIDSSDDVKRRYLGVGA